MEPVEFVSSLLKEGEELLYLTYFGSQLYGMATENSDLDYKGIFLPSKKDLLLDRKRKSVNWKSGDDNDKNSSEDVDVELWSLHYFFELVKKGETGAIDLLYSITNEDCVIYLDERIRPVFDNPLSLFDPRSTESFIGYAIGQAKKYGVKGSRLGMLKQLYDYLVLDVTDDEELMSDKLKVIAPHILEQFYDESYCFNKEINGDDALVICGKTHMYSIRIREFFHRIEREYKKYGERAEKARNNEGIDWKAVSHALRCIYQLKELLTYGEISFPLKDAPFLYQVKNGEFDWEYCEYMITQGLEEVKELQKTTDVVGSYRNELVEELILILYGERI